MGYANTTVVTCDGCGANLQATATDTASFLSVASTPRLDANNVVYPASPAIPATLCFCNTTCLTTYFNKPTTTTGA